MVGSTKKELTIFTIATNKYWIYFLELLPNIREFIDSDWTLEIIVLTNKHPQGELVTGLSNVSVKVLPSNHQDWPNVTLMRYHEILKNQSSITSSNFLWLDVDMKFIQEFSPQLLQSNIHLALHPGYLFNLKGFFGLRLGEKKDFLVEEFSRKVSRKGSRGAWENNPESTAFVRPEQRREYVHGAVWGGPTVEVLEMCRILSIRVEKDLSCGDIATWHDESHLNWYHANLPQLKFDYYFSGEVTHWTSNISKTTVLSLDKSELDKRLGL
jgi:hypothetical protein